ncbi:MAG TPA: ATP-binding protein [Anaerolineales bacterium]|nr:ATP-binding protein [Anaerolineales bacterium]
MSGQFYLDWAGLAFSLFNTIVLVWLGLTVLLNAERRSPGLWAASGELLLGGVFFLIHTVILGYGANFFVQGLNFWWQLGWIPVVTLPYAWYGVMLWYAGFWDDRRAPLHRRHRLWFALATLLVLTILVMLVLANPLPEIRQVLQLSLTATPALFGVPLLVLVYPLYLLLCLILSLDVLRRPAPSLRLMGDLARRRAAPWLSAATAVLIIVSLLVGWVMLWVISNAGLHAYGSQMALTSLVLTIARFDLTISALIALAVLLVGQAIISYEVFTGKALPRQGLRTYWRRLLILAAGYSVVVAWGLSLPLAPVFSLLLSTLLMVAFYGLLSWRAYAERERYLESLRPFVTSQRLYDHLLDEKEPPPEEADLGASFRALGADLLEARQAYLIPLGASAALAGPALAYPAEAERELPQISGLLPQFERAQASLIPLPKEPGGDSLWALSLWSERGLVGALVLGEKWDGRLYTQEEIELARTAGERLVDTLASAGLARRLVALQRQRLSEVRVLDGQTRRVMHDEVLPQLHAAILALNNLPASREPAVQQALEALATVHRQVADLLHDAPRSGVPEVARLGLLGAIDRLVATEFESEFDQVSLQISAESERAVQALPPLAGEVLYYAVREALRNAARHGRGADRGRPLNLKVEISGQEGVEIVIEDTGVGIGEAGQSVSGAGQGLALHSAMLAVLGGTLSVEGTQAGSTKVVIRLPLERGNK